MDKINHTTKDILGGNIEKIAQLFPSVVTEAQDEATGELKKVVDFDLLRQHLSDTLVEGDRERFRLDWPGKKASILKANTPISKTLRPVREDSVDFDTTQNVFIEGDNFEVLKVLQESYLGKIKMIYIDPPYNTGKDFIYRDNFAQEREDYEEEIGVRDDENGGKLVKNTETNGRYHSDWLSMMQERLIVARDLLDKDGVIFISIDDNEQSHLKKLCSEVFGEENFIAQIVRNTNSSKNQSLFVSVSHEYCLAYAYDISTLTEKHSSNKWSVEKNNVVEYKKRVKKLQTEGLSHDEITEELKNLTNYPRFIDFTNYWHFDDRGLYRKDNLGGVKNGNKQPIINPLTNKPDAVPPGGYRYSVEKLRQLVAEDRIHFHTDGSLPTIKRYLDENSTQRPKSIMSDDQRPDYSLLQSFGLSFDNPKQLTFIRRIIGIFDEDSLILDFFSGSATTAHAVMQLNAEDGGNRKHIQVQLAEPTDPSSEAYKAGYKSIPEISRERIRRAGKKIREDYAEQIAKRDTPLDTGFRAYKLSSSNFINTAQHPNETTQASLLKAANNIKEDRTAEDLLTETILDLGLTLDLPIEVRNVAGHTVYFVSDNSLAACFDDNVTLDIAEPLAAEKPLRVVFKDSSFASDEVRVNIDIRLKQLSPETEIKVL